jgi:hypothetical protein
MATTGKLDELIEQLMDRMEQDNYVNTLRQKIAEAGEYRGTEALAKGQSCVQWAKKLHRTESRMLPSKTSTRFCWLMLTRSPNLAFEESDGMARPFQFEKFFGVVFHSDC